MAVHIGGSTAEKFVSTYLVAVGGNDDDFLKARIAWADKLDSEMMLRRESRYGFHEGLEWKAEFFPKQMIFTMGNRIYGYQSMNSIWVMVNQTFKDCHDRLHKIGGNQFFPVEVLNKDGSRYPDTYYFFVPTTVIDAINPELGGGRIQNCCRRIQVISDQQRRSHQIGSLQGSH